MAREIRIVFSEKENDLKEYLETKSSGTFYLKELLRNDMNSNKEFKYILQKNEEFMTSIIDKISNTLKQVTLSPSVDTGEVETINKKEDQDFICTLDADDLKDLI